MSKLRILLLFGAGASAHCLGLNPAPPVGKDLFVKLTEYSENWKKISGSLANIFKINFEEGMEALCLNAQNGNEHNLAELLRDMAIYFSQFTIKDHNGNLYSRLFEKYKTPLFAGAIQISTLNYECLIEDALLKMGMNLNCIYEILLKLHGSCNFIPDPAILSASEEGLTINMSCNTIIKVRIKRVLPSEIKQQLGSFPPAMSLFTREKPNIMAPPEIKTLQEKFQKWVKRATAIICVGARPYPVDIHIWDHIAKSNVPLYLVADREECLKWIKKYRPDKYYCIGEKFEDEFFPICKFMDKVFK